jgi:hypothetical protein
MMMNKGNKMNTFTVEVYKTDRRTKTGERQISKTDVEAVSSPALEKQCKKRWLKRDGYRFELRETYVTRTNASSGTPFKERYDTPFYCSPSSETYWSM